MQKTMNRWFSEKKNKWIAAGLCVLLVLVGVAVAIAVSSSNVKYDKYAPVKIVQKIDKTSTNDQFFVLAIKNTDDNKTYRQTIKIAAGETEASETVMLEVYKNHEIQAVTKYGSWRYQQQEAEFKNFMETDGGNDTYKAASSSRAGSTKDALPISQLKLGTVDKPVNDRTITLNAYYNDDKDKWIDDTASVENTINVDTKYVTFNMNGHGSQVANVNLDTGKTLASVKTEATAKTEAGTVDGLTLEGWYTDEVCTAANKYDFFSAVNADVTLYANWTPTTNDDAGLNSYWIAPASKYIAEGQNVAAVTNPDYKSETTHIIKSSKEIQADMKTIAAEEAAGTFGKSGTVSSEYQEFMYSDKYHLYTKWTGSKTDKSGESDANGFCEFRIINVGQHDSDGSTLTFQAVHSLVQAHAMNSTAYNSGGWGASDMAADLNTEGSTLNNYNLGFLDAVMNVKKNYQPGNAITTTTFGYFKFWLLSYSELQPSPGQNNYLSTYNMSEEGSQYQYWKSLGLYTSGTATNPSLQYAYHTRSGNLPVENTWSGDNQVPIWWRSATPTDSTTFNLSHENGTTWRSRSAAEKASVIPCFAMSASSTVTYDMQGHGDQVEQQVIGDDGKVAGYAEVTGYDSTNLEFAGWFDNPACSGTAIDFTSKTFTGSTTLYACWKATATLQSSYWISPSMNYVPKDENTAAVSNKVADGGRYVDEITGVIKTASEIQEDVAKIRKGDLATIAYYNKILKSDKYHLYTKIGTGTTLNDYVEFRILQVGEHDGGEALTFQATHSMPDATPMNTTTNDTNTGGWSAMPLRTKMQNGGAIYGLFNTNFTNDIVQVTKKSTSGSGSATLSESSDSLWLVSIAELTTSKHNCYAQTEGSIYEYYKNHVIITAADVDEGVNAENPCLVYKTRAGAQPSSESGYKRMYTRSAQLNADGATATAYTSQFASIMTETGQLSTNGAMWMFAIAPCFAFGGDSCKVTFNMQGHGTQVPSKYVVSGNKTTAPTAAEYGTAEGLKFEGWYTEASCQTANKVDFTTWTPTADTTLYANWVPDGDANKYWISPSYKMTTGNTLDTVYQVNGSYVSEEWNVKKSYAEIQADIKTMKQEVADGKTTSTANSKLKEYYDMMVSDSYHLYTKWGGSATDYSGAQAKNGYLECRIINVGEHDSDDSVLTFESMFELAEGFPMSTSTGNTDAFGNSALRTNMNSGSIYSSLCDALHDDAMTITKTTSKGGGSTDTETSDSQFFILSLSEYTGTTDNAFTSVNEGSQYDFYKRICPALSPVVNGTYYLYSCSTRAGSSHTGWNWTWTWVRTPITKASRTEASKGYYLWRGKTPGGFDEVSAKANALGGVTPTFALGGYLVQFDSQGGSDVDAQLLKSKTKATKPTDPVKDGYQFGGWYTDAACSTDKKFDFDNTTVSADTTLYAKWTNITDSYWLNYAGSENPEQDVIKTAPEIQADIAVLTAGESDDDYEKVLAEYTKYMNGYSDSLDSEVHLYTKLADGVNTTGDSRNDYTEFRIISLGEHNGDGTTVTWQMTHVLPTAQQMNTTDTNVGGYAASALHTKVAEGGDIYNMFKADFLTDVLKLAKTSGTGNKAAGTTDTSDKLWIASAEEVFGETAVTKGAVNSEDETQYQYYEHRGVTKNDATNESIAYRTRAGGIPTNQSTNYDAYHKDSEGGTDVDAGTERYVSWWLRSPSAYSAKTFTRVYNDGRLDHNYSTIKRGVALAVSMGTPSVKFKTLEHGTKSTFSKHITDGNVDVPTAADYGTSTGLTMANWYDNKACYGNAAALTSGTLVGGEVFYANWIPTANDNDGNLSYWISPSYRYIAEGQNAGLTGNVAGATAKERNKYVKEEWNVLKSSAEIKEDVKKIQNGDAATIAEYKKLMNEDKFHLYTRIGNGTAVNDYMESRIVEVGNHDNGNGENDDTTLTFQAVHSMPNSYQYNTSDTTVGGWEASNLRTLMNSGSIYALFNDAFKDEVATVSKLTTIGNAKSDVVASNDKFWLMSAVELSGSKCMGFDGEGTEYDFWESRKIGTGNNSALVGLTKSRADANVGTDSGFLRSPSRNTSAIVRIFRGTSQYNMPGNLNYYDKHANESCATAPCFSFGPEKVKFDTMSHGTKTVFLGTIDDSGHVSEPAASKYGESTGLTLEGWYTNKACAGDKVDFANDTFSDGDTLYANWIPTKDDDNGNLSYWISPSYQTQATNEVSATDYTTSSYADNSAAAMSNARDSYVSEEWNVLKSSTEIQEDMVKIKAGDATTIAEYNSIMKSDKYHLYTKWNGSDATTAKLKYMESRILEVGEHDGGEALTFQSVYTMPTAEKITTSSSNAGGWSNTSLRKLLNPTGFVTEGEGGSVYNNFNTQFTQAVAKISKTSSDGYQSTTTNVSENYFWLLSGYELTGYSDLTIEWPVLAEGKQYQHFKDLGIVCSATATDSKSRNSSLANLTTRAGTIAAGTDGRFYILGRTAGYPLVGSFGGINAGGSVNVTGNMVGYSAAWSYNPCFAFGAADQVEVTFDTQEHGNATYKKTGLSTTDLGTSAAEYGESKGLTLEGWYDNPACFGDKVLEADGKKKFTENTTLYANWIPTVDDEDGNLSYWISPSMSYVEEGQNVAAVTNAASDTAKSRDNYVKEEWNVLKSSAEIQEDLKKIKAEEEAGTLGQDGTVSKEYQDIMNSDKHHLFTKYNGSTTDASGAEQAANAYLESRIIEVGTHYNAADDTSTADGSLVTFQSTSLLPTSYSMGGGNGSYGWHDSGLRPTMSAGGAIYENFNDGFTDALATVTKRGLNSHGNTGLTDIDSEMWVPSAMEQCGGYYAEGTEYEFFASHNTVMSSANPVLAKTTRAGNDASDNYRGNAYWMRSTKNGQYDGGQMACMGDGTMDRFWSYNTYRGMGIVPMFAMTANEEVEVTFDTQEHGNETYTKTTNGGRVSTNASEYGTSTGLTLEGWYDNAACNGTKVMEANGMKKFTKKTTLYANWIPTADDKNGNLSYWISPSMTYVPDGQNVAATDNSADTVGNSRDAYVKEEWNVLKSSTEIQADLATMKQEQEDGTWGLVGSVSREYQEIMNSDKYHLYTAYSDTNSKGSKDNYVESRIIEVGNHDGDELLTFQTTHKLPTAYTMNATATNTGGWSATRLRKDLNPTGYVTAGSGGSIFNQFNDGFGDAISSVEKTSTNGNWSSETTTSADKIWLISVVEMWGKTNGRWGNEGTQYSFYRDHATAYSSNAWLKMTTREGNGAYNAGANYGGMMGRSTDMSSAAWFNYIYTSGGIDGTAEGNGYCAIAPCFAMSGPVDVTFDTQGHGNDTYKKTAIAGVTSTNADEYGTSTGLTLEGWYDNPACNGEKVMEADGSKTFETKTTLYANWIPTADDENGNLSYWIGPAMTYVAEGQNVAAANNSAEAMNNATDSYVKEEWHVLKSSTEIKADLVKIKNGNQRTIEEYTKIMNSDKYHLYTAYKGSDATAAKNKYVEARIIQVGNHQASATAGDNDDAGLTFAATHLLPTAYTMNSGVTATGGWEASQLRATMNDATTGFLSTNYFNTAFTDNLQATKKVSDIGSQSSNTATTYDKFWVLSYNEMTTSDRIAATYVVPDNDGVVYDWFKARNTTGNGVNPSFTMLTRVGAEPASQLRVQTWFRTAGLANNEGFLFWGHSNYGSQAAGITPGATNAFYANDHSAVQLCFSMNSEYNLDKTKFQTALKALDTKPTTLKFVKGTDSAIESLTAVDEAGIQVGTGVDGNKIGLYQSADKTTAYVAPMNKVDDVIYAPEDSSGLCRADTYGIGFSTLKSISCANLDTSKVKNMYAIFYSQTNLLSLDVSSFNTAKVTNVTSMFHGCGKLTSLDVTNFDTSNIINFTGMFYQCYALTSLDVTGFNTANATSMQSMFSGCTSLTSINVLNFNTEKVTSMYCMFNGDTKLTSLDLSSFVTSKVTTMGGMFKGCLVLTTITVGDGFVTSGLTYSTDMFLNCTRLVGGNGTPYSSSYTDKTYARIDTASTPGYFTAATSVASASLASVESDEQVSGNDDSQDSSDDEGQVQNNDASKSKNAESQSEEPQSLESESAEVQESESSDEGDESKQETQSIKQLDAIEPKGTEKTETSALSVLASFVNNVGNLLWFA